MLNNIEYLEVKKVLEKFDTSEKAKIPNEIIKKINYKANKVQYHYKKELNNEIPLEKQISKKAIKILIYLVLKYIADENQKERLKTNLIKNQIININSRKM